MKGEAGIALAKAILDRFEGLGARAEIVNRIARPWSSINCAGTRHRLSLHISGDGAGQAADRFRMDLDAGGPQLAGHVMADIAVTSNQRAGQGDRVRLAIEALTVESR